MKMGQDIIVGIATRWCISKGPFDAKGEFDKGRVSVYATFDS